MSSLTRQFRFVLISVPIGLMWLLVGCGNRVEPSQLASLGEHVGEIEGDHTVGQTFVASHDGLQAVDVLLATFARHNTRPVVFHLRADPQSDADLRTVTVSAAEIVDNAYHRFSFAPLPNSHHRRYYFFIASPESQPGDAVTAWRGPPAAYRQGSLYVDGNAQPGQLAFKLNYSSPHVLWGLVRDLAAALPGALAALALFLLPGGALVLWLAPVGRWEDQTTTLIVAAGLSAAVFPLLLLFSRPLGLRWSSGLTWTLLLSCAGLSAWRLRDLVRADRIQLAWPGWRELIRRLSAPTALFWLVTALILGVRWFVVRPLSVPLWGDSQQHTYIAQLMIDHGGLFDSWAPYSPYTSLTVHFGFHAAVALLHWTTGIEILRAVILTGQIFNALAALALYPLAVRIGGNRWAGVAAVLVAGLLMPTPMAYVNWGRYPQLAGQAILPVGLWLLWSAADHREAGAWKLGTLAAVAAAGMTLTYYRMPYYYGTFVLAWLLFYGLRRWRGSVSRWVSVLQRFVLIGVVAGILVLPWLPNILGGKLVTAVSAGISAAPAPEQVWDDYRSWRDIDRFVPPYLLVLFVLAFVWSLIKRRWKAVTLGAWTVLLASLVASRLIHLPGASHLQSYAILIALYLPVGLLIGWLAGRGVRAAARRWKRWGIGGAMVLLSLIALLGFAGQTTVLDPSFELVSPADKAAMGWIRGNTPPDATFLVNGFLIYGGQSAVGSDAGWWIPLLAGRKNTMPPQYPLFSEAEAIPGYGEAVVQLVSDLNRSPPTTEAGLEALCQFGVTHLYVGQGQGRVARQQLTPYLVPAQLVADPNFELLYHHDRVWIFALKDGVCP